MRKVSPIHDKAATAWGLVAVSTGNGYVRKRVCWGWVWGRWWEWIGGEKWQKCRVLNRRKRNVLTLEKCVEWKVRIVLSVLLNSLTIIQTTYLLYGLVPRPLISRDFILTEMVCPIQIEIMKKVRWEGLETSLHQKFKLPPESWALGGVLVYSYLSQCRVFLKNSTSFTLTAALTRTWSGS